MALNISLLLLRVILGLFFVIYRFRWIYDPLKAQPWLNSMRHMNLEKKLCSCGWGMHPALSGFVALVEITAGLGVISGTLTHLSALGLLLILIVANTCTAKHKIEIQNNGKGPEDSIDVVSCYLWTVEPTYMVMAFVILLLGPGSWSVDHLLTYIL
jgi:uncharacterized membrane protein YphA (DoxX/SURF4 family)